MLAGFVLMGLLLGALWAAQRIPPAAVPTPTPASAGGMPPAETFARVFQPCAHCHQIGEGARGMTGPPLQGVAGRTAGMLPGYPFSQAMRASGVVWTAETLDRFIAAPQAVVPGTRMMFGGLDDAPRRAALVAFLAAPKPD